MKKHTMILTVAMAIAAYAGAIAQGTPSATASSKTRTVDCKVDKGFRNLLLGLRSTNQGLTESAIMQVAELRILYPGSNIAETKKVIDSLLVHATAPSVRYKAYLASNVCDNPEWFAGKGNVKSEDEFVESVDSQLHERILGSRTN
jgi:hypothetical protein